MESKKHPPLLISIRWATQPLDYNKKNGVKAVYRFEKSIKIKSYNPKKDYNKLLKEALDTLMGSTEQYIQGCIPRISVTMKLGTENAFPVIMQLEDALDCMNEYVKDYFAEKGE